MVLFCGTGDGVEGAEDSGDEYAGDAGTVLTRPSTGAAGMGRWLPGGGEGRGEAGEGGGWGFVVWPPGGEVGGCVFGPEFDLCGVELELLFSLV